MPVKQNAPTPLRPEGERIIDAPIIRVDLNKYMKQIQEEKTWNASGHNSITVFKTATMRSVLIGIHKGASIKKHMAASVISVQVLKGKIEFIVGDRVNKIKKGEMLALHKNIPHSVHALEDSFFLLTLAAI